AESRPAEFHNNQIPAGRPKASDYKDEVKDVILQAIRDFEWHIYTLNPFPDAEQQVVWAREAWRVACQAQDGMNTYYELTERIIAIIKARKSNTRGDVITAVRPIVQQTYGFIDASDKKTTQAHDNIKLYLKLLDDSTFLYKACLFPSRALRSGYAEHPIVSKLIRRCFFTDKNAVGVQYRVHFDPIPLVTLALIFTAIEHCIEEWSTGVHVKTPFREEDVKESFRSFLTGLEKWEQLDKDITRKIRKKWHDRAR
ncbi:hypothetical protein B0H21DRAFT_676297, partial [Amylocystis lapponica]